MSEQKAPIGSRWRRPGGVIYEVTRDRCDSTRDVLLVPVFIPDGKKARKTWKYDALVEFDFERMNDDEC
ncbi:hypothetical protein [Kordiimonas sp.]|uniref:hypothetical protein n=1 Tax=Kordiimonas sp. TaxID=1970157 RepID=UPI003A95B2BE